MSTLLDDYLSNKLLVEKLLRVKESFDIVERCLYVGGVEATFIFVDGFVKDGEMQRIMQTLISIKEPSAAREVLHKLPYVEVDVTSDIDLILRSVLSGQTVMLCESFGPAAILIDARTYPARSTGEPSTDKVMLGARDGFVETLVMNTALIRRRIRDPALTMEHFDVGSSSRTDVVLCYLWGRADEKLINKLRSKLNSVRADSLTLGVQGLCELMVGRGWLNPFPKMRTTERPDTAAAQLMEGSIILLVDTCPQAMILPTSIFDFFGQTDDFCFPPLTGTYLRLVRTAILFLSVFFTPVWYLLIGWEGIPDALRFLVPDDPGSLPIILQLLLVELAVDGLKIASMNTPDMLSNSLSVIGALILGDFAVGVGWLCQDVILYMAFVSIAGFAQQNAELGYAFKFIRMTSLVFVFLLGVWGLVPSVALAVLLLVTNRTVTGERHYLYPLVPFCPGALGRMLLRLPKKSNDRSVGKNEHR